MGHVLAGGNVAGALIVAHTRGMYAEGHADHWGPAADYIERHLNAWHAALG